MSQHNILDFRFNTISKFLDDFEAPTTAEIYDHGYERAAVINKYNFTQEIIHSKDSKKQELIEKFEDEIPETSKKMQEMNKKIVSQRETIFSLNAANIIAEYNERIEKLHNAHSKFIQSVKSSPIEPLLAPSLDEKSKKYISSKLGVDVLNNIPQEYMLKIKDDYQKGIITKQEYEKKYNSLALKYSSIKINSDFYENIFNYLKNEAYFIVSGFNYEKNPREVVRVNLEHRSLLTNLEKTIIDNNNVNLIDYFYLNSKTANKNKIMILILHMMFAADFKGVPLNEEQTKEYKAKYGNDGNDLFYFKEFNGKRYFSSSDLKKLENYNFMNSKKPEDALFLVDLLEKGLKSISSLKIEENFQDRKYRFEKSGWENVPRYETLGMRGGFKKTLWEVYTQGFGYALTRDAEDIIPNNPSRHREFGEKAKNYMVNVAGQIYDQFPAHISEHISRKEVEEWARMLIDMDTKVLSAGDPLKYFKCDREGYQYYLKSEDSLLKKSSHTLANGRNLFMADKDSIRIENTIMAFQLLEPEYIEKFQGEYLEDIHNAIMNYIEGKFLDQLQSEGKHPTKAIYTESGKGNEHRVKILNKILQIWWKNFHLSKRPYNPRTVAMEGLKKYINDFKDRYGIDLVKAKRPKENSYRMTPIEDVKDDLKILRRLFAGMEIKEKTNSPYLSDIIDLEKDRNNLINKHNEALNGLKVIASQKQELIDKFNGLVKKLKELKMENYVVTNNVDKDKFITTMRTMVDMIKVGGNEDKIIDLTDIDNFDSSIEGFESLLEELDPITKRALVLEYVSDMNNLYKTRGHTDEYEEMRLDLLQRKIIYGKKLLMNEHPIDQDIYQLEKVNYDPRYIDKQGIKVYEGKHFPLFIDKETLSIYTLEWTSKYPTLTISTICPELLDAYKNKSMIKWFEKNSRANNFEKMVNEDYYEIFYKDFDKWYKEQENLVGVKTKDSKIYADALDRMREIFSLIQTNYFVQLRQPENKSIFIDIDPNYLDKFENSIGAISFMNMKDQSIVSKFDNYQEYGKKYQENYAFIDPLNYKEKASSPMVETNFRKIYGLNKEDYSKNEMKTILARVKQLAKDDFYQDIDLLLKNSIKYIYGEKSISTNELPENIKNLLDQEISNLRLFTNIEDLEKYRIEFEETMNRKFEFKELK